MFNSEGTEKASPLSLYIKTFDYVSANQSFDFIYAVVCSSRVPCFRPHLPALPMHVLDFLFHWSLRLFHVQRLYGFDLLTNCS